MLLEEGDRAWQSSVNLPSDMKALLIMLEIIILSFTKSIILHMLYLISIKPMTLTLRYMRLNDSFSYKENLIEIN